MPHNMTVTIEDPLWERMKECKDVRWSVVMKEAVKRKINALAVLEKMASTNILSEEEITRLAVKLGKKVSGRK